MPLAALDEVQAAARAAARAAPGLLQHATVLHLFDGVVAEHAAGSIAHLPAADPEVELPVHRRGTTERGLRLLRGSSGCAEQQHGGEDEPHAASEAEGPHEERAGGERRRQNWGEPHRRWVQRSSSRAPGSPERRCARSISATPSRKPELHGVRAVTPRKSNDEVLVVDGHEVRISNPQKVLFPDAGYTKLDVARYLLAVGAGALRAAGGRPNMLVRYPNGIK